MPSSLSDDDELSELSTSLPVIDLYEGSVAVDVFREGKAIYPSNSSYLSVREEGTRRRDGGFDSKAREADVLKLAV